MGCKSQTSWYYILTAPGTNKNWSQSQTAATPELKLVTVDNDNALAANIAKSLTRRSPSTANLRNQEFSGTVAELEGTWI